MEFFKCSIGGEVYGSGVTEIERGGAEMNGIKVEEVCVAFILLKYFSNKSILLLVLFSFCFVFIFQGTGNY